MGGRYTFDPTRHGEPEFTFNLDEFYFIVRDDPRGGKNLLLFRKHIPTITVKEHPALTIKTRNAAGQVSKSEGGHDA